MVSAWTCYSLSWFNFVIKQNEFLNYSVWAVGTMKHLVLLVVSCCTKFDDTWSGKCLARIVSLVCFLGSDECFSGEGWDRSLTNGT